jgi:hypothetical protein
MSKLLTAVPQTFKRGQLIYFRRGDMISLSKKPIKENIGKLKKGTG